MSSRMDKYYDDDRKKSDSRTKRHKGIYKDIPDDKYDDLNLTNNVSVIKTDSALDLDDIKELINEKYEKPHRRSQLNPYDSVDEVEDVEEEDTKEYDLAKVIEAAHKNKEPNYDRERFAHIKETQYDILNSLNIDKQEFNKDEALSDEEVTIINLIKTVNENAEKNHHNKDEDDLFSDLIGDDDTELIAPIPMGELSDIPDKKLTLVEELERTKQLSKQDILDETKLDKPLDEEKIKEVEENKKEDEKEGKLSKTEELSNSFYTGKFHIDKNDMDDFLDLEKEMKGGSIVVKILIAIVAIMTIAILIYVLSKYLK